MPASVAVAASGVPLDDGSAYAVELRAAAAMVASRREEFRTGRSLARTALAGLGVPATGVGVGPARAPVWPDGVVGSITHCPGFAAAAVARTDDLTALGVDAEPAEPLPTEGRDLVGTPAELARVEALGVPDRLVFGAKEAVYKAWFPVTRSWLDLLDVHLVVERGPGPVTGGRFRVEPVGDALRGTAAGTWLAALDGTWSLTSGHLLCAAASATSPSRSTANSRETQPLS